MFTTINGIRTYYETRGKGRPLIAVHGGPGVTDHWEYGNWLDPLTDTHQVVLYDLRGCGQSDDSPQQTYSHDDFVSDLDVLRAHLGFERFAVLGTSYGGFIAQEYALRHGDRLTHLILQDTAASMEADGEAQQNALDSDLPGVDPEMLQRLFSGQMLSDEDIRQAMTAIMPLYRATPDAEADARDLAQTIFRHRTHNYAFSRNLPNFDLRDRLGEIIVPTLVICGRHDWITPPGQSEFLAAHIPGARLMLFERSGHQPMIEQNEEFIALVRAFLASSSPVVVERAAI